MIFAGLTLCGVGSAEAALLLPEWPTEGTESIATMSVGSDASIPCPCDGDRPPEPCYDAPSALPAVPVSSTGTSLILNGASASAAAVPPALLETAAAALVVDYLRRESRVMLPVPFLSGVFRPPRVAG